jgi:ATP-dependent DNA ligase
MITDKDFMLCNSTTEQQALSYDKTRWVAQKKADGERIIAVVINHDTILVNRRGKICNFHFEEVAEDLNKLDDGIIDGEIISLDDDFNKLQRRALTKDRDKLKKLQTEIPVKFQVFDILAINGVAKQNLITHKPLKERIQILNKYFENKSFNHTELLEYGDIDTIYNKAKANDSEGIVLKDLNGVYEGKRSNYWIKCKFFLEKDIVFTKYEINPNGIRVESEDGIACQVGGFEQSKQVKELLDRNGKVELTLQYLEETEDKKLRFPSFKKIVG